jgi:hypothetical protein
LWAEIATMSQAPRGSSTRPKPWTASQKTSAPRARAIREISATGWITPISLLTSMTATRPVPSPIRSAACAAWTTPSDPTGSNSTSHPSPLSHSTVSRTQACSVATVTIRRLPSGSRAAPPFKAQFAASVAPEVK